MVRNGVRVFDPSIGAAAVPLRKLTYLHTRAKVVEHVWRRKGERWGRDSRVLHDMVGAGAVLPLIERCKFRSYFAVDRLL